MAELGHLEHGAHETLEDADLRSQSQREQHQEEEQRPALRSGELREDVRHHDEGEARALRGLVQLGLQAAIPEAVLRREVVREEAGGHDAAVLVLGDVMGARVVQVLPAGREDGDVAKKMQKVVRRRHKGSH